MNETRPLLLDLYARYPKARLSDYVKLLYQSEFGCGHFAPDDAENVKSSILSDVIVPGVKAAIADVISIVLFGDTGRIGSRKSGGSRIAYQKYYDDRRDDRREYGRPRAAVGFEYDDIIFETRGDADLVLDQLESAIAKYEVASVADPVSYTHLTLPTKA